MTLWVLAALKQANNLRGNSIYNGQVLYIPGIDGPTPPQPDAERVQFTPGAVADVAVLDLQHRVLDGVGWNQTVVSIASAPGGRTGAAGVGG